MPRPVSIKLKALSINALFLLLVPVAAYAGNKDHQNTGEAPTTVQAGQPAAQTFVYQCSDGYNFIARIEGEGAWLFLPDETVRLPHVPSASGSKYREGQTTFWSKGDEASIGAGATIHRGCKNNPAEAAWENAKLNGADFRAVGNEPGWHLEITAGEKILYVGDYGQTSLEFATPEPLTDQQARSTRYEASGGGHVLSVVLKGERCADTMSDETFETSVTLVLDGKEYHGCGRALH